jgi:phosphomannomutase
MGRLIEDLEHTPQELTFGTSGLRSPISHMTDLECYINTRGFLDFIASESGLKAGDTIYLAGDLRDSTPRIMRAVNEAALDAGYHTEYCGLVPTPAVAYYASLSQRACIMVTGSHIPADRNGIKFYKPNGEVLKEDEAGIKQAVAAIRESLYDQDSVASPFDLAGMLRQPKPLPAESPAGRQAYKDRFLQAFPANVLSGRKIVFYQHSAVGRDLLVEILQELGAEVVPVGRSDTFIPIDSENVTPKDAAYFKQLAAENPDSFAIVSTDGDSDRPFVVDAGGNFHRGDGLGAIVAAWFNADFAAYTASTNDAVDSYLNERHVTIQRTKIGSPYIVSAMLDAAKAGHTRVVSWEVNGGFMVGTPLQMPYSDSVLKPLPTRDALLPILVALVAAVGQHKSVAEVFAELPPRFTQAGLIDNFPTTISKELTTYFGQDTPEKRHELHRYFSDQRGFGEVTDINTLDGIRITFANHDIAHIRPSGNAPQMRIYSIADLQARADQIVADALVEPDGIIREMQASFQPPDIDQDF